MTNNISIKGTREGLTITLGQGELDPILEELGQRLQTQGAFFRQGQVALQVDNREMAEKEIGHVRELLVAHEMLLRTVITTNIITQRSADALGLRLAEPPRPKETAAPHPQIETTTPRSSDQQRGVLVHHMVRSGQVIRHTGHIIVIGDVNTGAEIIAGGDVVIWGRLRGIVHAGSSGNREAVVCALDLSPLQLRIGDLIARPDEDDDDQSRTPWPEIAHVQNDAIVVEPWNRPTRGT
ncbi:MAG: septum site-determining protein MinC [Chloroflexi bacterium RBG_13_56_8]|nr:MAG: septum site-determining protein MinC [Chloroflexi bacterium RBG_13_56_8]